MTWVKMDDRYPDHPSVAGLTDGAFRLWCTGIAYCSQHLTDGFIPEAVINRWGVKHADRAAAELIGAGRWRSNADGYEVVNYLAYQRSRAQVEALSEKRSKAGKKGATAKQLARQPASNLEADDRRQNQSSDPEVLAAEGRSCDDDPAARPVGSSSEDPDRAVWVAFAAIALEDQAEPPSNTNAWLTSVARRARKERHPRLIALRDADPTAGPVQLARWIYDDIDPVSVASVGAAELEPWEVG